MVDIRAGPGDQIVEAKNVPSLLQEEIAQVRSKEPCSSRDNGSHLESPVVPNKIISKKAFWWEDSHPIATWTLWVATLEMLSCDPPRSASLPRIFEGPA